MSRITGIVRVNRAHRDVRIIVDGFVLNLGLLDKRERAEVAQELRWIADDVAPEDDESYQADLDDWESLAAAQIAAGDPGAPTRTTRG
jgi:hypothetical protein